LLFSHSKKYPEAAEAVSGAKMVKKRSESRLKTELIQVRATPQEKADLKKRAAAFGVSVGELCRRAIFGAVPKSNTDQAAITELATTRADLGRLGGLLKGWLAGSFSQPAPRLGTHSDVVRLLREIEAAQKAVVDVAQRVAKKP
jgi:Mobilization protein NikA